MFAEEEVCVSFGIRLRKLRRAKKMTQEELAGKLYVDRTAIQRWERGERGPKLFNLVMLSAALGCSIDYLATGVNVNEG